MYLPAAGSRDRAGCVRRGGGERLEPGSASFAAGALRPLHVRRRQPGGTQHQQRRATCREV